jgi:nucleotide-binding universal stress UspA family protein
MRVKTGCAAAPGTLSCPVRGGFVVKTIIVPLDGSRLAARAVSYAAGIAKRAGARLVLLRAVDEPPLPGLDRGTRYGVNAAARYLTPLAGALGECGVSAQAFVAPGSAPRVIAEAARELSADLVVMSTHGRSGLGRWLFGSVAEELLHDCPAPVLLLAGGCLNIWEASARPRIVVALDGSDTSTAVIEPAVAMAETLGAGVVLLRVAPFEAQPYAVERTTAFHVVRDELDARVAAARDYLSQVADELGPRAPVVVEQRVEIGRPAAVIRDVALEPGVQMLALATHGRTGLARAVLGSVTAAVVHRSPVPVLVVRPAGVRVLQSVPAPPAPIVVELSPLEQLSVRQGLDMVGGFIGISDAQSSRVHGLLERIERAERATVDADRWVELAPADHSVLLYALEMVYARPEGVPVRPEGHLLGRVSDATLASASTGRPIVLASTHTATPLTRVA